VAVEMRVAPLGRLQFLYSHTLDYPSHHFPDLHNNSRPHTHQSGWVMIYLSVPTNAGGLLTGRRYGDTIMIVMKGSSRSLHCIGIVKQKPPLLTLLASRALAHGCE